MDAQSFVRHPARPDLSGFEIRRAEPADRPEILDLMALAADKLQRRFLTGRQIAASFDVMGLDGQLVEDGTYYVVRQDDRLIGCGGWSFRARLYGGDHSKGGEAALLDPARDAARIRAMYTHPDHARRGVARLILATCEDAARGHGFARLELMATLAGEPLYRACGFEVLEALEVRTPSGILVPARRMGKVV